MGDGDSGGFFGLFGCCGGDKRSDAEHEGTPIAELLDDGKDGGNKVVVAVKAGRRKSAGTELLVLDESDFTLVDDADDGNNKEAAASDDRARAALGLGPSNSRLQHAGSSGRSGKSLWKSAKAKSTEYVEVKKIA